MYANRNNKPTKEIIIQTSPLRDSLWSSFAVFFSFIGTSSSAPIVSGAIALLLEKYPTLTRIEVENILKNTSDKIGSISYKNGKNDYYGYGKINLYNMLNY